MSSLYNRFVPLPALDPEKDAVLSASVPFHAVDLQREQRYLAALAQACRRWGRLLTIDRQGNNSYMGEEDGLALMTISTHLRIFSHVIKGLDALEGIRFGDGLPPA
jgi:hypothetical protein